MWDVVKKKKDIGKGYTNKRAKGRKRAQNTQTNKSQRQKPRVESQCNYVLARVFSRKCQGNTEGIIFVLRNNTNQFRQSVLC